MPSKGVLRTSILFTVIWSLIQSTYGVTASPMPQAAETTPVVATDSSSKPISAIPKTTASVSSTSTQSTENLGATASTSKPTAIRVTDSPSSTVAQSSSTTTAESIKAPRPTGGSFPVCHDATGPFRPFCLPNNASEVWVGSTYYVTWDPDYFTMNSTITIELNYANATGKNGDSAYTSPNVPNAYGYVTIEMNMDWLQGQKRNNLTLFIIELDPTPDQRASILEGPTISLTKEPTQHYQPPPHTKAPNHLGLILGLPISLGFVFLMLCGLCIGMRRHRKISLGNIMGKSGRGYGIGQSRIQRLGGGRKGKGAIRLGGMDGRRDASGVNESQYRDELAGGHNREPSLGSLVSEGFNDAERAHGNVFRNEVQRLKTWK